MAATFCSQTARPVPVRACASGDRPLIKVAAVLPRIKGAVAAGAAAALLVAAPPALAADLFVGEEIFNANCGGLVGSLCGGSSSSSASSVRSGRSGDAWQTPGSSDGSSSSNGGSSSSSSSAGVPLPLAGPGRLPPARLDSSGNGLARGSPWVPGGPGSRALLRRPLLRAKRPAALMLLQAACHTGGQNSVQLEKTLDKAALEQYLTGGFNIEAIETQVENGKGAMPAWGGRLSEEEIQGVAAYVFKQADGNLW